MSRRNYLEVVPRCFTSKTSSPISISETPDLKVLLQVIFCGVVVGEGSFAGKDHLQFLTLSEQRKLESSTGTLLGIEGNTGIIAVDGVFWLNHQYGLSGERYVEAFAMIRAKQGPEGGAATS